MTTVLIVEDERDLGAALVDLFGLEGYPARVAPDIEAAQTLLANESFDVVVTDLFRGAGASIEHAVGRLRAAFGQTPVILITGHREAVQLAPEALGLASVIVKPFDVDDLFEAIRSVLALQQLPALAGTGLTQPAPAPVATNVSEAALSQS
jgi:DNA-binding NtrC family response regulator